MLAQMDHGPHTPSFIIGTVALSRGTERSGRDVDHPRRG